ncbi:exported hypothetical protein [Candidatus Sulfotelmatobacter kueseliae]|uniref:Right handed beta helix domain-containing protein n=1 Tax=Candidatus Sulfotelmatobacter kueseliae TaxID=2042962 RepID=A0A2U3KM09_9BACT|nr:exported hypothetical protein [Candidatus Sulfotelmatobacter kueseliae]
MFGSYVSTRRRSAVVGLVSLVAFVLIHCSQTQGQTLVIQNQSNQVYSGLQIRTTPESGLDCIQIIDSTNITIENSEIGPCGGNGINIFTNTGSVRQIHMYDNYIHPETHNNACCDYNDGIFITPGVSDVTIQGNVIAYGESNVVINGNDGVDNNSTINRVTVTGNFLLNPRGGDSSRGQNIAAWYATNVLVFQNYALSSRKGYKYPEIQEDSINFGLGAGFVADHNYVTGGHSASGCGMIADEAANNVLFARNWLVNTGQCGIGIASGTNQLVDGNRIFNARPIAGGGNTAIYVWNQYSEPCGPVTVSHNIGVFRLEDGTYNSFWNGGGCDPATVTNNRWDQAAWDILYPPSEKMPPPLIPPQPRNCVARSPYSTQTRWPKCH